MVLGSETGWLAIDRIDCALFVVTMNERAIYI